jgi:hypothetical protein
MAMPFRQHLLLNSPAEKPNPAAAQNRRRIWVSPKSGGKEIAAS